LILKGKKVKRKKSFQGKNTGRQKKKWRRKERERKKKQRGHICPYVYTPEKILVKLGVFWVMVHMARS